MTVEENQAKEEQEFLPFATRMVEKYPELLSAACNVAYALQQQQPIPLDQRQIVDAELKKIQGDEFGQFNGDIIALSLGGYLRTPNIETEDEMSQLEGPDGTEGIRQKNAGKSFEKWVKKDREEMYEFEKRLDALVDRIDLGKNVAYVVLGQGGGNHMKAFHILRRATGVTRSCTFRNQNGEVERWDGDYCRRNKKAVDLGRRTQDSVKKLLEMVPTETGRVETVLPDTLNKFAAVLKRTAAEEQRRKEGGVVGWAVRFFQDWLAGKESQEGPEGAERVQSLKTEIQTLNDQLALLKCDLNTVKSEFTKTSLREQIHDLEADLKFKQDELAELQKPAEKPIEEARTVRSTGTPLPEGTITLDEPGRVVATVQILPASNGKPLAERIAELEKQLAEQQSAFATHGEQAVEKSAAARRENISDEEMEDLLHEARILRSKSKASHEMTCRILTELVELRKQAEEEAKAAAEDKSKAVVPKAKPDESVAKTPTTPVNGTVENIAELEEILGEADGEMVTALTELLEAAKLPKAAEKGKKQLKKAVVVARDGNIEGILAKAKALRALAK